MHVGLVWLLITGDVLTPEPPPAPAPTRITFVRLDAAGLDASLAPTPPEVAPSVLTREARPLDVPSRAGRVAEVREQAVEQRADPVERDRVLPDSEPPPDVQHAPVEYVRVDHPSDVPVESDRISDAHSAAIEEARARVTATTSGPRTPMQDGSDARPGPHLAMQVALVDPRELGGMRAAPVRAGDRSEAREGSGGSRSDQLARGATGQHGAVAEGGAPARAASGSQQPDRVQAPGGPGGMAGYLPSPDGDRSPQLDGEGTGDAALARYQSGSPRPATARDDAEDDATGTRGDGLAVADSPGLAADAGGRPDADVDAPAAAGLRGLGDAGDGEGEASAPFDPVEDLRAFMGWERPELVGEYTGGYGYGAGFGAAATSPSSASAPVVRDWASVSAREDPLGRYMRRVEEILVERWLDNDLSIQDRARGIQGDVVVQYVIRANGRTEAVVVARHSGHAELDLLALAAIPERLPRIPREVERDAIHHQVTLRYRNPLVVTAAGR
ncbi:MAG: TonB family protein [Alphaproteobacteria bacterium]|nr:TonB family protein [Alphaproteobacteria bacterium]